MMIAKVAARVAHLTETRNGRKIVTSAVSIRAGEVLMATAVLGGRWTAEQALKEYMRLPHRFTNRLKTVA